MTLMLALLGAFIIASAGFAWQTPTPATPPAAEQPDMPLEAAECTEEALRLPLAEGAPGTEDAELAGAAPRPGPRIFAGRVFTASGDAVSHGWLTIRPLPVSRLRPGEAVTKARLDGQGSFDERLPDVDAWRDMRSAVCTVHTHDMKRLGHTIQEIVENAIVVVPCWNEAERRMRGTLVVDSIIPGIHGHLVMASMDKLESYGNAPWRSGPNTVDFALDLRDYSAIAGGVLMHVTDSRLATLRTLAFPSIGALRNALALGVRVRAFEKHILVPSAPDGSDVDGVAIAAAGTAFGSDDLARFDPGKRTVSVVVIEDAPGEKIGLPVASARRVKGVRAGMDPVFGWVDPEVDATVHWDPGSTRLYSQSILVVEGHEQPVAGAWAWYESGLHESARIPLYVGMCNGPSDPTGRLVLDGLVEGEHTITIATQESRGKRKAVVRATVPCNSLIVDLPAALRVFVDPYSDSFGFACPSLDAYWRRPGDEAWIHRSIDPGSGMSLWGVPQGRIELLVQGKGWRGACFLECDTPEVVAHVRMFPATSIRGRVVLRGEDGLPGVRVAQLASRNGRPVAFKACTAITDRDGCFEVILDPSGTDLVGVWRGSESSSPDAVGTAADGVVVAVGESK